MRKAAAVAAGVIATLAVVYLALDGPGEQSSLTRTFNRIYAEGIWGKDVTGKGTSGSGSTLEITREYRAYIEDFIRTHDVKSVVDAGCGDWTFSSEIDWGGASYLGVDIASDVIARLRQKHERENVRFEVGDITQPLPPADLLISKDVLQHLPNELVHAFIRNNLRADKYKWVILTNDRGRGLDPDNLDTSPGGYRVIDLAAPPFDVKGLLDLPITFGTETRKVTSLIDFRSRR